MKTKNTEILLNNHENRGNIDTPNTQYTYMTSHFSGFVLEL